MTATDPTVRLRPITADEFPAFVTASKAGYAEGIELHGGQTHQAALQKAESDFPAVLPMGLQTPGHYIFTVEADGVPVGRLWLAEREMAGRRVMFVYDVTIDAGQQGHGYGRAAMQLAEEEARARDIHRIELNVFGGNSAARSLYRSLGYDEVAVSMRKLLDPSDA